MCIVAYFPRCLKKSKPIANVGNPDPPAWSELGWGPGAGGGSRSRDGGKRHKLDRAEQGPGPPQPGLASWPRQRAESSARGQAWPADRRSQCDPSTTRHPLASPWHLTVHFLTRRSSQSPLSQVSSSSRWSHLGIKRTQHFIYTSSRLKEESVATFMEDYLSAQNKRLGE